MKIRKTPYKWAIEVPKNDPRGVTPRLETDDLGSQKSQNALETGGGVIAKSSRGGIVIDDLSCQKSQNAYKTGGAAGEKKEKKRKNKKYILKS